MIKLFDSANSGHYKPAPRIMAKPRKPLGMIGVTVISPSYEALGNEAVRRMREFSGLDIVVIRADDADGFATKIQLDQLVGPRPIVFFDSDWWLLRPLDFRELGSCGQFCAVHDPGIHHPHAFCANDSAIFDFPPAQYFNSGFFVCDLGNPAHRKVFADARQIHQDCLEGRTPPVGDIGEQTFLNAAVQRQPDLLRLLPQAFNYSDNFRLSGIVEAAPREIIGLHAACFHLPEKWDRLTQQAAVYELPVHPLRIATSEPALTAQRPPPFPFTPAADCGETALCLNLERRPDRWEVSGAQGSVVFVLTVDD